MTQATDCATGSATEFVVEPDMIERYRPHADPAVEGLPWMHPLDAFGVFAEEAGGVDRINAQRTAIGLGDHRWALWVARALGVGLSTVKQYDPNRRTHDLRGPSCLYRYFDADGNLLYVGIAKDPDKRRREHERTSQWLHLATERTVEWYDDRDSALAAERRAIRDERPIHNRVGNR